ncbi:MAG: phosphoribosylformylglycinamidine synthase [Oscillospiraceae bacterium]|jgi:phosphoribosylformylglycinamidine synthase|nr:phosphoribosylformylglycinamidine synthase [Oscillospiraceae bacterium]
MNVYRCYVEKKPGFDGEAQALLADYRGFLRLRTLRGVRQFHRYDIEGIDEATYAAARSVVLSEPVCDNLYEETLPPLPDTVRLLAYESLPGQYDQRADSCAQCIQMITGGERPLVRTSRVLALDGISPEELAVLAAYVINPVECGEAPMEKPATLRRSLEPPAPVAVLDGFTALGEAGLSALHAAHGLAMDMADLLYLQAYFRAEERDPTVTELKVVDTYWSDHCRHTTFHTHLSRVAIGDARVRQAYDAYLAVRREIYGAGAKNRPVTLMDIATCGTKWLKKRGRLPHLDDSAEVNACTVRVRADVDGREEDWLLLFKNETHNHPTEIEPFGGAATCIGGAIRDPLSGRAYVYQAMRVTGSGDPRAPVSDTLSGKLPQRKLTVTAAAGYSSYGNQIGVATGLVREIYHPGYLAKRMELGAVVAAAPAGAVVRETPAPGDLVILLGGRTGRDGIGGATGSSKSHNTQSVSDCAAEVQKGNAPEERKLQRLFKDPDVTRLIRRCNDFGAGGVAVAVGELADGLLIRLDRVPKKYEGLTGTELAISESQERMAVVVSPGDAARFIAAAEAENLEATVVAEVTESPRLVMEHEGRVIVDLARAFLDANGAARRASVHVAPTPPRSGPAPDADELAERLLLLVSDLNFCSQKGLVERFDNTVGAGSVLMPHGGKHRLTPTQVMAALLPVPVGHTTGTASVMSHAFDPYLSESDPFDAARRAVIESVAKLAAAGCSHREAYLTLQEYFPRLRGDADRWGLPFAALLGAFETQCALGVAAIGGKDSMSGSFLDLDVPPTLVSFAVAPGRAADLLSPEWKGAGHPVSLLCAPAGIGGPDYRGLAALWDRFHALCAEGRILSAWALETGGTAGALCMMSLGNGVGFEAAPETQKYDWFARHSGALVVESETPLEGAQLLGHTTDTGKLVIGATVLPLSALRAAWEAPLEHVFPTRVPDTTETDTPADIKADAEADAGTGAGADPQPGAGEAPECAAVTYGARAMLRPRTKPGRPRAVVPVFPGTNCEYDTARALSEAGADPELVVVRNLTPAALADSEQAMNQALRRAQMLVLPGGFSAGDEPDGSGKFIAAFFRSPRLSDAVRALLYQNDGLILGICNGFQALIKLGLVPFGDIRPPEEADCTLTFNTIGRYQSRYVTTRVASVLSPWLRHCEPGDTHTIAVAHGEGRFVASPVALERLIYSGQVAFQYCDPDGRVSMDIAHNPNGSLLAVEGITSPDGRVLGKMGHTERAGQYLAKNIPGEKAQPLFAGGVDYFRL